MWLPKDERKTLSFYYQKTNAGAGSIKYSSDEPTDLIKHLSNEAKSAKGHQITSQTIKQINRRLGSSGLIKTQNIGAREIRIELRIELTPEGLQLGQRFNSKTGTIAIWCTEYIWLWVILGVIIGTITLLVTIFKG